MVTTAMRFAICPAVTSAASQMPTTGNRAADRAASSPVSSKQAMIAGIGIRRADSAWIRPGTAKASS